MLNSYRFPVFLSFFVARRAPDLEVIYRKFSENGNIWLSITSSGPNIDLSENDRDSLVMIYEWLSNAFFRFALHFPAGKIDAPPPSHGTRLKGRPLFVAG